MELIVKWSHQAEREFDNILNYWNERNGSEQYSMKLISLVEKTIETLARYPESGQSTDKLPVRHKIVKDYFLYYSYNLTALYIVDICDMRRNPEYIKSLLT